MLNTRFATLTLTAALVILLPTACSSPLFAQPPAASEATAGESPADGAKRDESKSDAATQKSSPSERETRIAKYLTGATFTGRFTVEGETEAPKSESYTIDTCEPLAAENTYRLKVKIRYGDVDGEFPMELKIRWAGSTPVITLDAVWIPGLGTFSSRVLIHEGRYAGTWQHDAKGGHLYGTITPAER